MKNNKYIFLIGTLLFASCVSNESTPKLKSKVNPSTQTPTGTGASPTVITTVEPLTTEPTLVLKTFNQYNANLAKLTGVNAATPSISSEYEKIKTSLPGGSAISSFTPFNQIAEVRLSFAYCGVFVDSDPVFKAYDYNNISAKDMTKNLLEKFFGKRTEIDPVLYDKYEVVILKIMNNDAGVDDGVAIGKLIPVEMGAGLKINLTKMSCTAILSSAEFTTI